MTNLVKTTAEATASWSTPPVDVFANDAELLVHADLPGAKSEDVHVSFHEGTLSIEAVRQGHTFRRTFRVSDRLEGGAIRAELDNGVLAVHLPKAPHAQPRAIPVSAG